MINNNYGGRGEDITYSKALIECLPRTPFRKGIGTGGSQEKLTANFVCSDSLLTSTGSNILPGRGSKGSFNERLGVRNVFSFAT